MIKSQHDKYNIGKYLYSRLPSHHRLIDEQNNLLVQRMFDVLNEGFKVNMDELDLVLTRVQASKCPEENLNVIAQSLGADWISTIDTKYQRQIISMLIKLYQQKGTIDTIRFIASELSGFEATIIEGEIPDEAWEEGDELKRLITIKLQAPELDDPVSAHQHESTISEVVSKFVPVHTKFVLVVTYFYDEPHYLRILETESTFIEDNKGEELAKVNTDYTQTSKVMLQYKEEDKEVISKGHDFRVMSTLRLNTTLCNTDSLLTTPYYVDKITTVNNTEYVYE